MSVIFEFATSILEGETPKSLLGVVEIWHFLGYDFSTKIPLKDGDPSRILRRYRSRRRRLPPKGAERANQVTKGVPMGRIA